MKRYVGLLLVLCLLVSFSVIATTGTVYAIDANQSGPYLAAVQALEKHIQSLRER